MEMVVAGSMLSGIVLITYTLQKNVQTQLVNIGEQTEIILDQAGAVRAINDDLSFSDPSFNYVNSGLGVTNQRDDFWTVTDADLGARTQELRTTSRCLNFFSVDKSKTLNTATGAIVRKNTLLVKPSYFYNNRTVMTAPLVYNSSKMPTLLNDNKLAIPDQYIKVSGMVPVFVSGTGNNYYRDYSLLLKVGTGGTTTVIGPGSSPIPFYPNPMTGSCSSNNSNLDQFLRCLPTPGGGSTSFFVTPIVPISYCLKRSTSGDRGYQLYRKKGTTNILIASGVEYLKLTRLNSNNPIINIDLHFCSLHAQSGVCKK